MSNLTPLENSLQIAERDKTHSQTVNAVNNLGVSANDTKLDKDYVEAQWYIITKTLHRVLGKTELYDLLVKELAQVLHQDPLKAAEKKIFGEDELPLPGMVYRSPAMRTLAVQIHKMRDSKMPVLITGESGTGKEGIARAIHSLSPHKAGPFVAFNCTVVTRDLISSQLFGHRRGSFTGADSNYQGSIRSAENGSIFLDEIGDLPLELQPKLLRFLQEGEVHPVGETKPVRVNVRVIAATNRDLEAMVGSGEFREDLYYRLNVLRFHMPPLRERKQEIPLLVYHLLERFSREAHKQGLTFTPEALTALTTAEWPGNIRQLSNEIQRAVALLPNGEAIGLDHLSPLMTGGQRRNGRLDWVDEILLNAANEERLSVEDEAVQLSALTAEEPNLGSLMDGAELPAHVRPIVKFSVGKHTLAEEVADLERQIIVATLQQLNANLSRTAKQLGLTRRGLYLKMSRYAIDPKQIKTATTQDEALV